MSRPSIPRHQVANYEISVDEFSSETVCFHRLAAWTRRLTKIVGVRGQRGMQILHAAGESLLVP